MTQDSFKDIRAHLINEPPEDVKNDPEKLADWWCIEPQEDPSKKLVRSKFIQYCQERVSKGFIPIAYYVSGTFIDDDVQTEWVGWQNFFENFKDENLSDGKLFDTFAAIKRLENS